MQAIVDILFDGTVDENSNITINGLRKDFSGKCHFTVINDCVLISYVDIFHSVYKPIHGENTRRAMGKFIEHFKQLKDKYTIKVISRSIDSSKYGIGIEPTLIITGFTEEELTILRGNSKVVKPITNFGYNNHKFALIEKDAKPDSTYIIFDNIEIMLNYKYRIQEQYGIESEVYHIDTNDFDLDKDVVKLDDNKQYVVIPESLIANTLLNTNGGNSNVVSGYNYSALNAVFDKEALLDHYHDIVSEITKHDLILNRGASLELEKIHLSDVSSDVRTNGGWGKLYKEVSGKELNESGFGTVKICDGLYGIKDGLFNIYSQSNKEYGINEF